MKSDIQFKDVRSKQAVTFLDTMISIEGNKLITNLYTKPTAAYDYLQRSSYHPQHLIRAIPKGQFMRIRRICTHLSDYKEHARKFVDHFKKRGYNENSLHKTAEDVASMDRNDLLTYKHKVPSDRTPLVITYHHKLSNIPSIVRKHYDRMIRKHPDMKAVFPSPPVVSFRRPRNLRTSLTSADHTKKHKNNTQPITTPLKTNCTTEHSMNNTGSITNSRSGITLPIAGGAANKSNVIYAVRCTQHDILYVGYTTRPVNQRMNNHRSDIKLRPQSCELVKHFATCGCDFDRHAEISILEHVAGSSDLMELHEDKWIAKLDTKAPRGLNEQLSSYGKLHYDLFK